MATIRNTTSNTLLSGTSGNDSIYNSGNYVTITGGDGSDYIDSCSNGTKIFGNAGSDTVTLYFDEQTVDGGEGNDSIFAMHWLHSINGGTGDDIINIQGSKCTISGGKDNDVIREWGRGNNLFRYNAGDGNDLIEGFDEDDTLSISGGSYSTTKSGNDVIVTVDDGKISLIGAASLSKVNIKFKKTSSNKTLQSSAANTSLVGGTGNDSLYNEYNNVTMLGNAGNDTIKNTRPNAKIYGGDGADTIVNTKTGDDWSLAGYNSYIDAGNGNDSVFVDGYSDYVTVKCGDGDDTVYNYSAWSVFDGGKGNDSIYNTAGNDHTDVKNGSNVSINGGAGNDTILNDGGASVSVNGGAGDDSIYSILKGTVHPDSCTLIGGDGNDTIWNDGEKVPYGGVKVLIDGGKGNDNISNDGERSTVLGGKDNDFISNWGAKSSIDGGAGNDVIYNQNDSTKKTASKVTITGGAGSDSIYNGNWSLGGSSVSIDGGDGNDLIYNGNLNGEVSLKGGDSVTILGGEGNDSIFNYKGTNSFIDCGAGDDSVTQYNGKNVSINLGDGNDYIWNGYGESNITINGGSGNDTMDNSSSQLIVLGGDGNDSISLCGCENITVIGGKDNDTIHNYEASKVLFKYSDGDGNDLIYGFATNSTLSIGGGEYSSKKSGSDIIVTVGTGKITLVGASSLSKVNIKGTPTPTNSWKLNGTTAKYGTSSKTLVTVNGVKSTSGLKLSGKTVTVSNSSLNKKSVAISSGYSLKLGSDVAKSKTTAAKWSISGTTAIYKSKSTTAGYNLANNKITYTAAKSATNLFKINGIKLKSSNLSVSGNITSGTAKYTISGNNVIFTVGDGKITVKGAADKTFTYTDKSGTHDYTPAVDNEPYTVKSSGVTLSSSYDEEIFDVNDVTGGSSLVTIDASAVTHEIKVKGNSKANKIIAGSAGGSIDGGSGKKNDTLIGGNGSDIFVYYDGDGNDVIKGYKSNDIIKIVDGTVSSISTSRENVIFNVGKGKITVQDAIETQITYIENGIEYGCLNGKKTFTISTKDDKTIATLNKNYWKSSFDLTSFSNEEVGSSITRINASAVTKNIKIIGNSKANEILAGKGNCTIIGGAGNDSIYGNSGSNVYVYNQGNDNDIIYNYGDSDKLSITTSGTVKVTTKGNDVVFTVGKGKITLDNAAGKDIHYIVNGQTTLFADNNVDEAWFLEEEDDFIVADNQLSSIVRDGAAYSTTRFDDTFTFTAENSSLPALTYSAKK